MVIGGNSLLGGRFSIAASLLGALIIQTIDTGILLAGFPSEFNLVIKAGLVLMILVLQSPQPRLPLASRPGRHPRPARSRSPPASPEPSHEPQSAPLPLLATIGSSSLAYASADRSSRACCRRAWWATC